LHQDGNVGEERTSGVEGRTRGGAVGERMGEKGEQGRGAEGE